MAIAAAISSPPSGSSSKQTHTHIERVGQPHWLKTPRCSVRQGSINGSSAKGKIDNGGIFNPSQQRVWREETEKQNKKKREGCVKADVSLILSLGSVHKTFEVTGEKGVWCSPTPTTSLLPVLGPSGGPHAVMRFGFLALSTASAWGGLGVGCTHRGDAGLARSAAVWQ